MSKGGGTQTATVQEIPSWLRSEIQETFTEVDQLRPSVFQGERVSPFSANQLLSNQLVSNFAQNNPLQSAANTGLSNIISGDFNISSPLQTQIDAQTDKAINMVNSNFARAGRFGSDAYGDAMGEAVTNASAPLLAQALERDAARRMGAIQSAPALLQSELGLMRGLGAVGAQERALQQGLLDAQMDEVRERNIADQARMDNILRAVGLAPAPASKVERERNKVGPLEAVMGLASLGSMFSDRRLKTNIRHIKTHQNGLKEYKWDWNKEAIHVGCNNEPSSGYIAQQVMEVYPDVVWAHDNTGYLMIDYSKLNEVSNGLT